MSVPPALRPRYFAVPTNFGIVCSCGRPQQTILNKQKRIAMWNRIALGIIKYRLALILIIAALTGVMGYYASRVQMSYDFARTVPLDDPDMIALTDFKKQFGED